MNNLLGEKEKITDMYSGSQLSTRISIRERYGTNQLSFHDFVINVIRAFPGNTLLDIGCGTGWLYTSMKDSGRNGVYYGVDVSENMIEKTKSTLLQYNDTYSRVMQGDAEERTIKFDNEIFFDLISIIHVLHHAKELPTMLEHILEQGTKDSTFFFTCSDLDAGVGLNKLHYHGINNLNYPLEMASTDYLFFQAQSLGEELERHFGSVQKQVFKNGFKTDSISDVMNYYKSGMMKRGVSSNDANYHNASYFEPLVEYVTQQVLDEVSANGFFIHDANVNLYICSNKTG